MEIMIVFAKLSTENGQTESRPGPLLSENVLQKMEC